MKTSIQLIPRYRLIVVLTIYVLLAACGRQPEKPIVAPTESASTQESNSDESNLQNSNFPEGINTDQEPSLANVIDVNLLTESGLQAACDYSENAVLKCSQDSSHVSLLAEVPGSDFARWRLWWGKAQEQPLTGTETLHLRIRADGEVNPNIYMVDDGDSRVSTKLPISKSTTDWQDIYIPLAEVQDDNGNQPDFASVGEIQVVFEWSDMNGTLEIDVLEFSSAWIEPIAVDDDSLTLATSLTLPENFSVSTVADDLSGITQIQYIRQNEALVSLQGGRVWQLIDTNDDHIFDQRHLYFAGLTEIVGLLHDSEDGSVWVGGRGQLYKTIDSDKNGVADQIDLRVDGMPWGRHQNNGLTWNPDPDPFTGETGNHWIYFGLGSTGDLEIGGELNATVLRFPKDGQGQDELEVVSLGNRNAYDVVWGQVAEDENRWHLFASENGPDFNDAPDEVNHIRWGHHYGFPEHFGVSFDEPASLLDELPYSGSLYNVTAHASASGLAYVTNPDWPTEYQGLYVSLFGQVFSEAIVGHTVEHIRLTPEETETGLTFRGEPTTFIDDLVRPLPMTVDADGNLIVGDYATGVIYRVVYEP